MEGGSLNSEMSIGNRIGRSKNSTVGRWMEWSGNRSVRRSFGSWGGGWIVASACLFAVVTMRWLVRSVE